MTIEGVICRISGPTTNMNLEYIICQKVARIQKTRSLQTIDFKGIAGGIAFIRNLGVICDNTAEICIIVMS